MKKILFVILPMSCSFWFIINCSEKPSLTKTCGHMACKANEECVDKICRTKCSHHDDCPNKEACRDDYCYEVICGDGLVEPEEECDDAENNHDHAKCTSLCTQAICGDGFVFNIDTPLAEECDDGNNINDDACSNTCKTPICGDGIVQENETCTDNLSCTVNEHCINDQCFSNEKDCTHALEFESCQTALCDESLGCITKPANIGGDCDDKLVCTKNDTCENNGTCKGEATIDCSELLLYPECQRVFCEEPVGCKVEAINIGAICNDGQTCSDNDQCQSTGICQGTSTTDCSHLVTEAQCQTTRCDDIDGCVVEAINIGQECSDNNVCTENDHCNQSGKCEISVNDCMEAVFEEQCQVPKCDPNSGCFAENINLGLPCDDGMVETTTEICHSDGMCSAQYIASLVSVTPGWTHTCGIGSNAKTYCWGTNIYGQLGIGNTAGSPVPIEIVTTSINGDTTFAQVTSGYSFTCGLTTDAKTYCWGYNLWGQLGIGNTTDSLLPVEVDTSGLSGLKQFTQISSEYLHICAISTENIVYCWGQNTYGQLGDGSVIKSLLPKEVDTTSINGEKTFSLIDAGSAHTCGITTDNKTYWWGTIVYGQYGNLTSDISLFPKEVDMSSVSGEKIFAQISSGGNFTCGITSENAVYCWGSNMYGQLGIGNTTDSYVPVAVDTTDISGDKTFSKINAGRKHVCAVSTDNTVYCWGGNERGQLGDGSYQNSSVPIAVDTTPIGGTKTFSQITAGGTHTCGMTTADKAYCWGGGTNGQLGDGNTANSPLPVPVEGSNFYGN